MKQYESQFRKLTEVGSVNRGKSKHRPRNAPELYGGSYPFIQTGDVKHANFYITEYAQTYSEKGLAQSKLWQPGTLCITIAANIADTAILKIPACFPDSIIGFIPEKGKSEVRFIKYCLDTYKKEMQLISQGTTQDNLSQGKLLSLRFRIPDYDQQQKIAAILSAFDELIENNRRRIALLEKMAEEIYREWFVRMRFPGHEKVKIVKGVPEGWERKGLSGLGTYLNGYAFEPSDWGLEGIPIIKIKEMTKGISFDTPRNHGDAIPAKYHFDDGAIIFSWSASLMVMIWDQGRGLLNQHLFKVDPFSDIPKSFLYFSIKFSIPIFESLTTGATMQHIKRKELDFVQVNLPPQNLRREFDIIVSPILEQKVVLTSANRKLARTRDMLLPRLISGKLSVENLDIRFPPSMEEMSHEV